MIHIYNMYSTHTPTHAHTYTHTRIHIYIYIYNYRTRQGILCLYAVYFSLVIIYLIDAATAARVITVFSLIAVYVHRVSLPCRQQQ